MRSNILLIPLVAIAALATGCKGECIEGTIRLEGTVDEEICVCADYVPIKKGEELLRQQANGEEICATEDDGGFASPDFGGLVPGDGGDLVQPDAVGLMPADEGVAPKPPKELPAACYVPTRETVGLLDQGLIAYEVTDEGFEWLGVMYPAVMDMSDFSGRRSKMVASDGNTEYILIFSYEGRWMTGMTVIENRVGGGTVLTTEIFVDDEGPSRMNVVAFEPMVANDLIVFNVHDPCGRQLQGAGQAQARWDWPCACP